MKIWFIGGVVLFALVFMFTAMLSSGVKKKNFFRAIIYLPNLIPVVAMTTMWTQYIYNPRYGMLKTFLTLSDGEQAAAIQWTSQDMLFWGMLIAYIWGGVGWFLLIILAGVERIPQHFYEAARLDGANQVQMFFQITLPLLRDVLRITVVMWSITVLNLFAFAKVWTPVVQQRATYTPAIYMYELAFGSGSLGQGGANVGKAAAVGVMLLLAVLLISAAIGRILKEDPNIQY
ncbi:MAG: sugar ABC transporter permease [Chloroflexi bacterium]|nr:sugar ABC transporter permease [Chloroflexota bacterium]